MKTKFGNEGGCFTNFKEEKMIKLGNENGFSFLEITIALGIIMILVSALVPVFSTQLDNAKIARAKDDVQLIAAAMGEFNANTGTWPIWQDGTKTATDDSKYDYLVSADGNMPSMADGNITTDARDTLDHQLIYNEPGGDSSKAYPDSLDNTSAPWRGPYLHGTNGNNNESGVTAASKDPWGNKYVVNVWALAPGKSDGSTANHYVVVVVSAGPNGKIDTPITKGNSMKLRSFKAMGDDIVCVI